MKDNTMAEKIRTENTKTKQKTTEKTQIQTHMQSEKYYTKAKYWATRKVAMKLGSRGEGGGVSSSCCTSDIRYPILVYKLIWHELEKGGIVNNTNETCPLSFMTQLFRNDFPSHGGNSNNFELNTQVHQLTCQRQPSIKNTITGTTSFGI